MGESRRTDFGEKPKLLFWPTASVLHVSRDARWAVGGQLEGQDQTAGLRSLVSRRHVSQGTGCQEEGGGEGSAPSFTPVFAWPLRASPQSSPLQLDAAANDFHSF